MKIFSSPARSRREKRRRERILALATVALIAMVWGLSHIRAEASLLPALEKAMPAAAHFEQIDSDLYAAWADGDAETQLGYVAIGQADGYGGPLRAAVAVNPAGEITGMAIVSHKETPAWLERVQARDYVSSLLGKSYSDRFQLGADVDGVTGATYTSRALAEAALQGSQAIARQMGRPVVEAPPPRIQFGAPEVVLLALFGLGYIGHRRGFKYKKPFRWGTMLAGLVLLGFVYNSPLTLSYIVKALLGYWPQWQSNLYWYFLLGGILLVFTVDNKNPYCQWFCPFGAAQECMGAIGGAKVRSPGAYRDGLKWAQRLLALGAILLGVWFRSPGLASFEIFGTLFSFVGSPIQFALLGIVLIAALFIRRPWCTYLCPLDPVVDFIRIIRKWILDLWQRLNPKTKTAAPRSSS